MLLYVLTTEGGNREDGNVYYARHLLVDAPEASRPAVDAILDGLFKGNAPAGQLGSLEFSLGDDPAADAAFGDPAQLVALLATHGYQATLPAPSFVIQYVG